MARMTTADFVAKVAWEGGVPEAIEYGLDGSDAADPEAGRLWQAIVDQYQGLSASGRPLSDLITEFYAYTRVHS